MVVYGVFTELLVRDLNLLEKHSLISMDDGFTLQPTGIHVHSPFISKLLMASVCWLLAGSSHLFFSQTLGD